MRRILQWVSSAIVFAVVFAAFVALVALAAMAMPTPEPRLVNSFLLISSDYAYIPVVLVIALVVLFVSAVIGIALAPARRVWNALRDNRTLGEIMAAAEARANRRKSAAARRGIAFFKRPTHDTAPTRELHV